MRKHIFNYIYLFVLQCGNYIFPLITIPLASRVFGPAILGGYNYINLIVGYFCLIISYGFNYTGVRRLTRNKDQKSNIFSSVIYCQLILFFISTVTFLIIKQIFPDLVKINIIFYICIMSCFSTIFQQSWIFQVNNDFRYVTLLSILTKAIGVLLIVLLVKKDTDINLYAFIIQGTMLISAVISFFLAIIKYKIKFIRIDRHDLIIFLREDFYIFLVNVLSNLYTSTSIVLLGYMTNDYSVGIYSAGQKIIEILINFSLLPLNMLLLPIISESFGRNVAEGLATFRNLLPFFIFLCFISVVFIYFFGVDIITIFYGSRFTEVKLIINILLLGFIAVFFGYLFGSQIILNLGYDKSFVSIQAVIALISLTMNAFLLKNGDFITTAYIWSFSEITMTVSQIIFLYIKRIKIFDIKIFYPSSIKNNISRIFSN